MKRKQKATAATKVKKVIRRHAKLAFIPHAANQHRPHLIRWYGITALLVLIVGLQAGYNLSAGGSVLGAKAAVSTQDLLNDTNDERTRNHLQPLRMNAQLSKAADLKARDMLQKQYWAHNAPDGTTPWHWFGLAGYKYGAAGENLAKNFGSADATTTAWMASPEHRANILDQRYNDVGFAVANGTMEGKPITLIVALYGEPVTAVAAGVSVPMTAPRPTSLSPMTRFGVALESMSPALFASLFVIIVAAAVALTAQYYRKKLPKAMRESWYRHHGLLKAGGMLSLALVMLLLYGGGQI